MTKEEWEKKQKESGFRLVKEITKKKEVVPNGIRINEVISPRYKDPIDKGTVDIYYFPHGIAEAAVIHIEDQETIKRSLIVHPITGKTKIEFGEYDPKKENR